MSCGHCGGGAWKWILDYPLHVCQQSKALHETNCTIYLNKFYEIQVRHPQDNNTWIYTCS